MSKIEGIIVYGHDGQPLFCADGSYSVLDLLETLKEMQRMTLARSAPEVVNNNSKLSSKGEQHD